MQALLKTYYSKNKVSLFQHPTVDLTEKTLQLLLLQLLILTLMANGPEGKLTLFPLPCYVTSTLSRDLFPGVIPMEEVFGSLWGNLFQKRL